MTKNLVIVESPTKTRTLKKFLGKEYAIEASMGHIRDLVKKDMGIGPGYEPKYEILKKKKDVVAKLRKAAKDADLVFLAPDPDREGEAIAWHISEVLKKAPEQVRRVTFNEITKKAVLKALENPGQIDQHRVDAQQARRILDRLMGFRLSPLLWEKVKQGLSAGRVQSVALKMVCDRQAEIDAFVPEEYWNLGADLEASEPPAFHAKLHRIDGKKAKVENGEQAGKIVADLDKGTFQVASIERKESKRRPGPPFITSRLQQEASRRYGFSVKRTMNLAQGLYEGKVIGSRGAIGLITYMRTDSSRIAAEALDGVRDVIRDTYGDKSLPDKPNFYKSKKGAQDAHEAIRPTTFDLPPEKVKRYLKSDEYKLYKLIWDRFVACQMLPAVYDVTRVDVENGIYTLRVTGKILKFAGFLAVYQETPEEDAEPDDDSTLPEMKEGEELKLLKLHSEQKFTQPPAQYSEATLVKALEENGIGRPSTYAQILSTLSDRSYVDKVDKRFRPTTLGSLVNDLLQKNFEDLINEGYTAKMEERLDKVEDGEMSWKDLLTRFDQRFTEDLEQAAANMPNVKKEGVPTDETCPECGSPLVIRFGRYGSFYGCSNYPECSYTRDVVEPSEEAQGVETSDPEEIPPCEKCGKPMALKRSRYGAFYGCTGYPECKNIRKIGPQAEPPKDTGVDCPECKEGHIQQKRSRRGKIFYSCNRYPKCKYALWNQPIPEECPECGAPFILEKTTKRKGTFRYCQEEGCEFEQVIEPPEEKPEAKAGSKGSKAKAAGKKKAAKAG